MHFLTPFGERFHAVRSDLDDFGGFQFVHAFVSEFLISEVFKGHTVPFVPLSDMNGKSACFVARRNDGAFFGKNDDQGRSVDDVLGIADALRQGRFAVDAGRHQFRRIDALSRKCRELPLTFSDIGLHKFVGIVDGSHYRNGVTAERRLDEKRLRVAVIDGAERRVSGHFFKNSLKLRSERRVMNIMYFSL